MSAIPPNVVETLFSRLVDSPQLLLQKLDLAQRRALLIELDAERYLKAAFLDDRLIDKTTRGFWTGIDALHRRLEERRPQWPEPKFIFHIGHCGSTLLSRLLAALHGYLPLREPPSLRTLAELERERGSALSAVSPEDLDRLSDLALYLYSRVFGPEPAALVKATSDCNNLIEPALQQRPLSRALLLSVRLETYLATMLRSPASRADVNGFARGRLQDLHRLLGEERWQLYRLSPGRRAAVGWLACLFWFERARRAEPERTLHLDFDDFLADPASALAAIGARWDHPADPAAIERLLAGRIMSSYSKAPEHRYDAAARARELDDARTAVKDEIDDAMSWAEREIRSVPSLEPLAARLR